MAPARYIKVWIRNFTPYTLKREQIDLSHGQWTDSGQYGHPPMEIPGSKGENSVPSGSFGVESCGIMTGLQGFVLYYPEDHGQYVLRIDFNNPYVGSNDFSATVAQGHTRHFYVNLTKDDGPNPRLTIEFSKAFPHQILVNANELAQRKPLKPRSRREERTRTRNGRQRPSESCLATVDDDKDSDIVASSHRCTTKRNVKLGSLVVIEESDRVKCQDITTWHV